VSFWRRPHIEAILGAATTPVPTRRADSPNDQLQSVLRNADGLAGPLRALGTQAAAAARQLLVSIEHADREVAELARSLDPGEEERLTARIQALGGASAEVRGLLEKQLDLVRRLSARIEEGREDRNRRIEMLKTLAQHLASLRASAAEAPADVPSLSERVRRLCGEIDGQALALAEARAAAARVAEAPTRARSH
jgi:chromosome segregation ATPase